MADPAIVAAEGTTITIGGTAIGQVLSITPPGPGTEAVETTHLTSTAHTRRPGQIPDYGEFELKIEVNPADAGYVALQAIFTVTPIVKKATVITYGGDGKTTHGHDNFDAVYTKVTFDALEENTNLVATVAGSVDGVVTSTAGS